MTTKRGSGLASESGSIPRSVKGADPFEKAPHESGMYIRWYADNIWLFVPVQQKLGQFLGTLDEFPFQQGSSLNASNINYNSLKALDAMRRLKQLEALAPPRN